MRKWCIAICALISVSALAAKPVKITPNGEGVINGQAYRSYMVDCSNGRKFPITAWDAGKRWCDGEASQDYCFKKQIKAAKVACKKN